MSRRSSLITFTAIAVILCLISILHFAFRSSHSSITTQPSPVASLRAALRSKGEPAYFADLSSPHVADADNAVWFFNEATKYINDDLSGPRSSDLEYGTDLPYPPEWHHLADQMMQANARAIDFAHEARRREHVAWNLHFDRPLEQVLKQQLPSLNRYRSLANILGDASLYYHFHGDDASALDCIDDGLHLSQTLAQCPTLISYLVAIGIQALCDDATQTLATGLTVDHAAHPLTSATTRTAPREKVAAIITKLLDDQESRDQFRHTLQTERVFVLEQLAQRNPVRGQRRTIGDIELIDRFLTAATQPSFPPVDISKSTSPSAPAFDRVMESLRRVILVNRTAAIGLAACLYRNDTGHYPSALDQLTPNYLPSVPRDPYGKKDAPLQYLLAENGARPVVFSVGPDQVSQTPDASVLPPHPNYSWRSWQKSEPDDQWFDLAAWRK